MSGGGALDVNALSELIGVLVAVLLTVIAFIGRRLFRSVDRLAERLDYFAAAIDARMSSHGERIARVESVIHGPHRTPHRPGGKRQ